MKPFLFFNKLLIWSALAILNSLMPSYASLSSDEDLLEISKSTNSTGFKRLREENLSQEEPQSKKQKIDQKNNTSQEIYPSKDRIFIFNVGQGNSQLAIYSDGLEEPFGILYDCGSSASTLHKKIDYIQEKGLKKQAFLVKTKNSNELPKPVIPNITVFKSPQTKNLEKENEDKLNKSTESNESSYSSDEILIATSKSFPRIIKSKLNDLKNLFIFLSHPDEDHIKLVEESLPETMNVLLILCGNFLIENDSEELKTQVGKTLSFINKRIKNKSRETYVTLPYFWTSQVMGEYSKLHYGDIKSYISSYSEKSILPSFMDRHVPEFIQENFSDFLGRMHQINLRENLEDKAKDGRDPFYLKYIEQAQLKNIYIWSMNYISNDINNHSPIISFNFPSLHKTLICTGDAGPEVFMNIMKVVKERSSSEENFSNLSTNFIRNFIDSRIFGAETSINNITLLMLPHHGSKENYSTIMLDLFLPDVLCISAGYGSQYHHPSTHLIEKYEQEYSKTDYLSKRQKDFWQNYRAQLEHFYLSFKYKLDKEATNNNNKEKTKGSVNDDNKVKGKKTKVILHQLETDRLPILSTGISGTIECDENNFYCNYTNYIKYKENTYKINFKHSVFISDKNDKTAVEYKGQNITRVSENKTQNNVKENTNNILKFKIANNQQSLIYENIRYNKDIENSIFVSESQNTILFPIDIEMNKKQSIKKFYLGNKLIIQEQKDDNITKEEDENDTQEF